LSFYLDTSVIVSTITQESGSVTSQKWLVKHQNYELVISQWVITELYSALALKVRTGQMGRISQNRALDFFKSEINPALRLIEIVTSDFVLAQTFFGTGEHSLRSGDALHLAIASRHGLTLVSNDEKLCQAAQVLGLSYTRP
jgi:uncharacterized protein